jgi:hypothetical protein
LQRLAIAHWTLPSVGPIARIDSVFGAVSIAKRLIKPPPALSRIHNGCHEGKQISPTTRGIGFSHALETSLRGMRNASFGGAFGMTSPGGVGFASPDSRNRQINQRITRVSQPSIELDVSFLGLAAWNRHGSFFAILLTRTGSSS